MHPIQPGTSFTIVRQLGMPGDVATYYVRAVVKNSVTGAVLATVNLTDLGSQRFAGTFQAPADKLGTGLNIDITTSVYTDSAYTTLSQLYTIENDVYVVRDTSRWGNGGGSLGGGAGMDINYEKIRLMLIAELKALKFPEFKETDLSGVLKVLTALQSDLKEVGNHGLDGKISTLHDAIAKKLDDVSEMIKAKPDFKETDLTPVLEKLDIHKDNIKDHVGSYFRSMIDNLGMVKRDLFKKIESHAEEMKESDEVVDTVMAHLSKFRGKRPVSRVPSPEDYMEDIDRIFPKKQ